VLAKRLLAVALAIGLVALALFVRQRLKDDGDATAGPGTSAAGATTLVCATELAAACQAVTGMTAVIEPAGRTYDSLVKATSSSVIWLTLDPWPQLVDDERTRQGTSEVLGDPQRLAASPVALIGRLDRMAALTQRCNGTLTWKCIGDLGDVALGMGSGNLSAGGALVLANAVVEHQGTTDINPIDLDVDDQYRTWIAAIGHEAAEYRNAPAAPLLEDLVQVPRLDVAGALEYELRVLRVANPSAYKVTYPQPMARADVVLTATKGARVPSDLAATLRGALIANGCLPASTDPPAGLPAPNVIEALRATWNEVAR